MAPITIKQVVTLLANTPAQKATLATLTKDPLSTVTSDEIQIPSNETWFITDLFISVAGDVGAGGDSYVQLEKNRRYNMGTWGPLSTMLISNQQRPQVRQAIGYRPYEILRIPVVNIAAIAGANVTDNVYMEVQRSIVGK